MPTPRVHKIIRQDGTTVIDWVLDGSALKIIRQDGTAVWWEVFSR